MTDSSRSTTYSDLHWTNEDGLQIVARNWQVESPIGTVLLIHGIGDHSGRFEHVANFLNQAGYSVLTPDLRGHGRSEGPRGYLRDFDMLNDDIEIALQKSRLNCPDGPAFLYGHSMGALTVINFVLKTMPPIAGVIATSPPLRIAMPAPAWQLAIGRVLGKVLPKFALSSGLDINELSDDPQVASRTETDRYQHDRVTPAAYFGMVETGEWCLKNASSLKCPMLLMHGKADRITDHTASMEFSLASSQCVLRLWDEGKHELHNMSYHLDVLAEITRFQNRCIHADSPNTD